MTFEKLVEIIANVMNLDKSTLTMETSFKDDLKADSLDVVEIIMEVENEFGVEISDEEIVNYNTIGDVVRSLDENI
ncbi:MAG: acyl carrier protein [Clostridia bacterium]|nr:acyl carrier protein [Clostridia bacterium]MDY4083070.1 acyl carrier protein [Eubacteriales bacterium]